MKLSLRILSTLAMTLLPIMALWGTLFYFTMVSEINDEADDSLEQYASLIITRCREGRTLPALNSGSNNSYTIKPITPSEAQPYLSPTFHDEEVFIPEKNELEPARVMTIAFLDEDGRYLLLKVATPTFDKDDLVEAILIWTVSLFALLIIVVVVVATLSMRRTLRPLYALLSWLDGYTPGSGHQTILNDTDITEFRHLNKAAESAVNRSEDMLDRQKQFIGNASHELQTPLAVVSNRVEYLINNTSPSEEQLTELIKIDQSLRHNIRLNRTLLQLVRIESGEVAESEEVDIAEIIRESVDTCNEIYEGKAIECHITAPNHLYIYINETLARTLVVNLVKNAYLHSEEGSSIEITLSDIALSISNSGTEPLDKGRVFDRFYTRTTREGSTGLGLAIVRSIANHYGYTASYNHEADRHRFTIAFK